MPGFQVVGRVGSNSVSAPLCGRRLPAIFPKRCKAGGWAGSSWRWLPGRWLGGEQCRSVWLSRPAHFFRRACFFWPWDTSGASRWASGFLHFVPTARGDAWSWVLPTFCPYGAWAVVWNCKTEKCTHTGLAALRKCKTGKCKSGERCRSVGLGVPVAWSAWRRSQSGRGTGGRRLVLNLNLSLNLGGAVPCFSWGRLRLVCGEVFRAGAAGAVAWGGRCRSVGHYYFAKEKIKLPPPIHVRMGIVWYWVD
jgi:hypothetical protein